jgi:hypothetical protein
MFVLLVLLVAVLIGYLRWMARDNRHKARVEAQLERQAQLLERLADNREQAPPPPAGAYVRSEVANPFGPRNS